jgi:hypothetical protein
VLDILTNVRLSFSVGNSISNSKVMPNILAAEVIQSEVHNFDPLCSIVTSTSNPIFRSVPQSRLAEVDGMTP